MSRCWSISDACGSVAVRSRGDSDRALARRSLGSPEGRLRRGLRTLISELQERVGILQDLHLRLAKMLTEGRTRDACPGRDSIHFFSGGQLKQAASRALTKMCTWRSVSPSKRCTGI